MFLLTVAGEAGAIGLGELRGHSELGDRPRLEFDILGGGKDVSDPTCFRVVQPQGDSDLPWLKKAVFSVRKGTPPVLLMSSDAPLREPILQLSIHIACGHDVVRDYVLLASPAREGAPVVESPTPKPVPRAPSVDQNRARRSVDNGGASFVERPRRQAPRPAGGGAPVKDLPDRLVLSFSGEVGEPSLRLSTELPPTGRSVEMQEAQREILRLEFRMLLALQEQATTQMAAAEKLRNMEETLGELQKRTAEFSQELEKSAKSVPEVGEAKPVATPLPPAPVIPSPAVQAPPATPETSFTEWTLYGLLLGALLGVGGWLGWRNFRERRQRLAEADYQYLAPDIRVDPKRAGELEEFGAVDLMVEPAVLGEGMQVDVHLDAADNFPPPRNATPPPSPLPPPMGDAPLSISSATVDEHFEANPVMELADIMLSFGRVKGAAQALQEFIDNNPQEALQPWIRLMDVYRMAGMRDEFDSVARNLNQNFNVEVQQWDPAEPTPNRHSIDLVLDDVAVESMTPPMVLVRAESIEEMPRILQQVLALWPAGDVVEYLHQLLRDNRGGKRAGFTLPVVEEILFLIELKDTLGKM